MSAIALVVGRSIEWRLVVALTIDDRAPRVRAGIQELPWCVGRVLRSGFIVGYGFPHPSHTFSRKCIMSAIRITKKQVAAAATARAKALKEDPDFRRFEEEQAKEMQAAEEERKNRKEKD